MKILFLSFCSTLFGLAIFPDKALADIIRLPDFRAEVISTSKFGRIGFKEHGAYRLWGLQAVGPDGFTNLMGSELLCYNAGATKALVPHFSNSSLGSFLSSSQAIFCEAGSNWPYEGKRLYQHLIETEKAIEICAETNNAFGTCK